MMFLSRRIAARTEIHTEKYKYVYVALKLMIIYFKILIYFLIYIYMHYKEFRFKEESIIESSILYLKFCFLLRNIFI